MARTLTVRRVDDEIVRKLKLQAVRHGRSAEAEHREILRAALLDEPSDFWEVAARLRAATGDRQHTPAEDLVREGRDER